MLRFLLLLLIILMQCLLQKGLVLGIILGLFWIKGKQIRRAPDEWEKFFLTFPGQDYDCKGNRSYPKKGQTHLPVKDQQANTNNAC